MIDETTTDVDKFEERWEEYADDLARLRFSATKQEHADQVKELREELTDLIHAIAEEKRSDE